MHRSEPVASILSALATTLGVLLRGSNNVVRYSGAFYGQGSRREPTPDAINVDSLLKILKSLPRGVTEPGCHPGAGDSIPGAYSSERLVELASLCDSRVAQAVIANGVELCSFHDIDASSATD